MIPDEAVEAALYAWGFSAQNIDERRELVTHILEAAAPHIMTQAWDEGYTTGNAHNGRGDANPYRKPADA